MKNYLNQIINWYLFPYSVALLIVLPLVYFFSKNIYQDENTWNGILIEAHGMIFDIIVIGILVTVISKSREKRIEIKRYLEEIDDYRWWKSQDASQRISGIIRRVNNRSKTKRFNISNCWLTNAYLNYANLHGAHLVNANLQDAHLSNANLRKANMWGANLQGAHLVNANLQGAHLINANLQEANLVNANLREANIDLFQLKNVIDMEGVVMPDGTLYNGGWKQKIDDSELPKEYWEKWKIDSDLS